MGTLSGYTVLELAHYAGGAATGMLLADQGANVIKIEPPSGDLYRETEFFSVWNRGKNTIAINFSLPEELRYVTELAEKADIIIENLDYGEAEKFKLSYKELSIKNKSVIYLSLSSFPKGHVHESLSSLEGIVAAASGVYGLNPSGELPIQGEGPSFHNVHYASGFAALTSVPAIAAALFERDNNGRGQQISLSIHDAMYQGMGTQLVRHSNRNHGRQEKHPIINRFYQCKDKKWINVNIGGFPKFLELFLMAINKPEWFIPINDLAHIKDNESQAHQLKLEFTLIWLTRTAIEWENVMAEIGVPGTMCRTISEWINEEQAISSGAVTSILDYKYGLMKQPGIVVKTKTNPGSIKNSASPFHTFDSDSETGFSDND